jgi:hypothetical protein
MTVADIYPASPIKQKRQRATRDEMSTRRRRIKEIVELDQPMTVRQVFYQAVVGGIVGKAETDYDKIQALLTDLRRSSEIPMSGLSTKAAMPASRTRLKGFLKRSTTPGAGIARTRGRKLLNTSRSGSRRTLSSGSSSR